MRIDISNFLVIPAVATFAHFELHLAITLEERGDMPFQAQRLLSCTGVAALLLQPLLAMSIP